ncbi:5,10-methylenetetrahydrofolate reductase [Slackia heliotrinireducens]|uniref:Methylenetetrahydrofolate reductase n=1 Tax=Slackia heliotrinireducens (strain ATCC 29202 / DSM 20476 / NCTC 11029 / RHS 1) TaxID=471855 RepID=C7N1R9_SLAHD|nr:methylenetetrahydrofolate reductase [Slackia heliotrinireducens]ACV23360.1 5,10-methylenetetrahydrofolate reductase [Slackia heliotrinireducens DSM 20476]VEH02609.1 5,10-methylenetetrahydrofolate reductase [Slackia heliotrinireducens]
MHIAKVYEPGKIPVSFETFPPKGEMPVEEARGLMAGLAPLNPAFVSVTYSAGGAGNSERTVDVAKMGQDEFGLTCMAHLTCMGATKESVAREFERMREAGIENVLALRGDKVPGRDADVFHYAKDLIPLAREAGFCVGAAAYPEGHVDCLDFDASIRHLKEKQDAGAEFFVTQLFFENDVALRFLDAARSAGITVPITFGIMPFMSKAQLTRMIFMCGASLPSPIIKLLNHYEDDEESLRQAGIEYACNQFVELGREGVDGLHVYTMNRADIASAVMEALRGAGIV